MLHLSIFAGFEEEAYNSNIKISSFIDSEIDSNLLIIVSDFKFQFLKGFLYA